MKTKITFLLLIFSLFSCKESSSSYDTEQTYNQEGSESYTDETYSTDSEVYPDGTYSADVDYYNPDTGTRSSYTLNVEVESNELTVIQWSNGGWLDSTHFSPEELDSNGSCSFTTYEGKQYEIQITGSETSYTDENRTRSDEYYDNQKVTCPECGGKKYSYDDVCDDCQDKAEHTCKRCGEYDTFMWSSDDLCSDCKRADEDKKRQEEEY